MNADVDEICPGIYLGSCDAVEDAAQSHYLVKELKVSTIISVLDYRPIYSDLVQKTCSIHQINVSDRDGAQLHPHFSDCINLIKRGCEGKRRLLVHCSAGQSRSVTVVVAFMVGANQIPLESALNLVKERRPCSCPNPGFWLQLHDFELKKLGTNSLSKRDLNATMLQYRFPHHSRETILELLRNNSDNLRKTKSALFVLGDVIDQSGVTLNIL